MPSVRAIIVNYNAGDALISCVESLLGFAGSLKIVVADNLSQDGSMAALQERFGQDQRLELRFNEENIGFGRAVNRVARNAGEDYVLILNPDCILETDALDRLVEALEEDDRAALAAPWIINSEGHVQSGTWRRLPDPWNSFMTFSGLDRLAGRLPATAGVNQHKQAAPGETMVAEAVSGACMLLRRSVAEPMGYFDEAYKMHCEDLDLMYRLKEAAYHCLLVPGAMAVHSGGLSSASRPWWVHRQKHLGMQRYFSKFLAPEHSPPVRWMIYAGIWIHYLLTLPVVLFQRISGSA